MRLYLGILLVLYTNFCIYAQNDNMQIISLKTINSTFDDFAPIFLDSTTILFTSSRPNPLAERNMSYNQNIYISNKTGNEWTAPKLISYLSNSDNHEATAGISSDRKTVFIYKTFNGGDIYNSDIKGKILSAPKKTAINSQWQETSACFSNNTLYFVSNRPGGKGEHDIYYCTAIENGWSEPINLEILNTEFDENFISVSAHGDTLFFSSKGHNTTGGYDVFRSLHQSDSIWTVPENMGNLINSSYDEINFSTDPYGTMFFSSNRPDDSDTSYNIYTCFEKKIRIKIPLEMTGNSPLNETKTGTVELIRNYIEVEGFKRNIPKKIEVNISAVFDSLDIIKIGDIKIDKNLTVIDNNEEPLISINIFIKKIENVSLEEVKKSIDFKINYCAVQVGAFTYKTSITDFAKDYPLLGDKVLMIQNKKFNRFVMRETFEDLDSAIVLQKKCLTEYHSVFDTFIAVYDMHNVRILIYFDVKSNMYKMLRPEDQFKDDELFK